MKYFKTINVHEELQLLVKFYMNKINTAWFVNLRFTNQAGIIGRWLKLQMNELDLKKLFIFKETAKCIQ